MTKQGFFDIDGMETYGDCSSCKLYKQCQSPQMDVSGQGQKEIMLIGEAPGANEDEQGKQFIGKAGNTLRGFFAKNDVDMRRDCWLLNAVNCRPPNNRTPSANEIKCCRKFVVDRIHKYKPKIVFLFGKTAVESVIGHSWTKKLGSLGRWAGLQIPDVDLRTWICPTYHPSFLGRMNSDVLNLLFNSHIKNGLELLEPYVRPPIYHKSRLNAVPLYDDYLALEKLNEIEAKKKTFAFDYETTSVKPERGEILSISFCSDWDKAYSFMVEDNPRSVSRFRELLQERDIQKIAHNAKFEDRFSKESLDTFIDGWNHDTMMGAHCLDNRNGYTSLKFQTYLNFGIAGYDSDIEPYMKESTNGLNRLREFPKSKLLEYNALDSLFTFRLSKILRKETVR